MKMRKMKIEYLLQTLDYELWVVLECVKDARFTQSVKQTDGLISRCELCSK